jgi:PRD1 phage membrane DNA delivery
MGDVSKIVMGIIGVGLAATLVVNGPNTAKVISSLTGGFSSDLSAAEKG